MLKTIVFKFNYLRLRDSEELCFVVCKPIHHYEHPRSIIECDKDVGDVLSLSHWEEEDLSIEKWNDLYKGTYFLATEWEGYNRFEPEQVIFQ